MQANLNILKNFINHSFKQLKTWDYKLSTFGSREHLSTTFEEKTVSSVAVFISPSKEKSEQFTKCDIIKLWLPTLEKPKLNWPDKCISLDFRYLVGDDEIAEGDRSDDENGEDPHDSNQDTSTCDEDEDSDFDEDKYFSRVEEIQKRPWKRFQP